MRKDGSKVTAIILAAGIGSRLSPLTQAIPKCLLPVGGMPILEWQVSTLGSCGIRDIVVVGGYKVDQVHSFVKGRCTLVENTDYLRSNNMYSLYLARPHLSGDCIIVNGDVLFTHETLDGVLAAEYENLIAVDVGHYQEESMKVSVSDSGKIVHISKKIPVETAFGTSIDLYRFSRSTTRILFQVIENYIQAGQVNLWTEVAIDVLLQKCVVYPFDIKNQPWVEIDTHEDLREAETTWSQRASSSTSTGQPT